MYPYAGPQPKTIEELQAMTMPGGPLAPRTPTALPNQWQAPVVAQQPKILTPQDVQAMIDASLSRTVAAAQSPLSQFDSIFQRALSTDDFAAFTSYVSRGAPGFSELLKSDKLDPIAQLLWETIKENVK